MAVAGLPPRWTRWWAASNCLRAGAGRRGGSAGRHNCLDLSDATRPAAGLRVRPRRFAGADASALPRPRWPPTLDASAETLDATLLVPYTAARPRAPRADPPVRGHRRTSTAAWARCSAADVTAASPRRPARTASVTDGLRAGRRGHELRRLPAGGHHAQRWRETPTTTSARASRAVRSRCALPSGATYKFDENVIVGNVALYGATGGPGLRERPRRAALLPRATRVRTLVVEGVGDTRLRVHDGRRACSSWARWGINFAAGMNGWRGLRLRLRRHSLERPLQPGVRRHPGGARSRRTSRSSASSSRQHVQMHDQSAWRHAALPLRRGISASFQEGHSATSIEQDARL